MSKERCDEGWFVLDTTLNAKRVTSPDDRTYNATSYHPVITERVRKGEISYRLVVVIHTKERFEKIVAALLSHEGLDYLVRHYAPSPEPMPIYCQWTTSRSTLARSIPVIFLQE